MLHQRLREGWKRGRQKFWAKTPEGRELRRVLAAFPLGIFSAAMTLPGGLRPFPMAIAMALPGSCSLAAIAGGMVGCSVFGDFADNLSCLAALACGLGVKLMIDGIPRLRSSPVFLSAAGLVLTLAVEMIRCLTGELGAVEWLVAVYTAAVTGGLTYIAFFAVRYLLSGRRLTDAGPLQRTSMIVLSLSALVGMAALQIGPLNISRILVCLIILLYGERQDAASAAGTGICCAAAITLADPGMLLSGAIVTAAGYWAASFGGGRMRRMLLFLLTGIAGTVIGGLSVETLPAVFDLIMGAAIYLFLPEKVRTIVPERMRGRPVSVSGSSRTAARLRFSAGTLLDLEKTVEAVSLKLFGSGVSSIDSVYTAASEQVCRKCGLSLFCWDTAASQTTDAFTRLTPTLKGKGKVTPEDLPPHFVERCPKVVDLTAAVSNLYAQFISKETARRKVAEAKQVAAEQFEGLSSMLAEFSEELSEIRSIDTDASDRVTAMLREMGEDPEEVYCIHDRYDRLRIEIYTERPIPVESGFLREELSALLQRPLDGPSVVTAEDVTRSVFFEKARLSVTTAICQLVKGDAPGRISGDCCDTFSDGKGFFHLILSDGMGTGGRAAVDSIMTVSFVLKLIKAGFGFDAALKLINSSLLIRTGEESIATLDIGCIDLYTGRMEFLKAGAASSFVCREGKVAEVSGSSLPAGILQGVRYDRRTVRLAEGDLILMVSDGALTIPTEWLQEEIALCAHETPEKIAARIASLARRNEHGPGDDITVLAAKISLS